MHRTDPIAGYGYFIICDLENASRVSSVLESAGAISIGQNAFEYLRINNAIPIYGSELTADYIPLEAGLRSDISFNKGCYIGQEIIARMDSRGKLAKKLVKLLPDKPIHPGDELVSGSKSAGIVTSAADGPTGPVALAYVKSAFLETGLTTVSGIHVSIDLGSDEL